GGYAPHFERLKGSIELPTAPEFTASVQSSNSDRPSVLVLPFENVGGELNDFLAQGITEELIARLLRYKELSVICANTRFKIGASADPMSLGRRLMLGYILKGALRTADSRLRLSIQLLDVVDARYLWAESFDRELTSQNLWELQENLAAEVATRLGAPYGAIA